MSSPVDTYLGDDGARLISCTLSASQGDVSRALKDVLAQLYDTATARVDEQRASQGLTPLGAVMVKIRVEQWCEDAS